MGVTMRYALAVFIGRHCSLQFSLFFTFKIQIVMKHHYSINVQANGENHVFNVFCEEKNLETIADALCDYYRYVQHKGRIACVAKKGDGVTVNDFDILYRDCM